MRKRRLFLGAGAFACLAALVLTHGTAVADPPEFPDPPPPGTIIGVGAQTTQGVMNTLCNLEISDPLCASYDVDPQPGNITTKPPAACTFPRPNQGGSGFDRLIASPACVDFARVVTSVDRTTRPPGFTYIPLAQDALTYAVRGDGTVPRDLSEALLKRIYQCDPALVFNPVTGANPNGFRPLIGIFGAGNRTLLFNRLGITDSADYAANNRCVTDGLLANDGRVLTHPRQLITYSSAPYLAQVNQVEPDIHGQAVLGSINGIPPAILNANSFISRTVFNVVRTSDIGPGTPINRLFVGDTSQVCSRSTTIQRHGFSPRSDCGNTSLVTTN